MTAIEFAWAAVIALAGVAFVIRGVRETMRNQRLEREAMRRHVAEPEWDSIMRHGRKLRAGRGM